MGSEMKICYLGVGVWGYSLACILATKGYQVVGWSIEEEVIAYLKKKSEHPKYPGFYAPATYSFTTDLDEALEGADIIVEGVTAVGLRPVFQKVKERKIGKRPIVLTSKGIEQNSCLLLSEVLIDVLGEEARGQIGCISGPSIADEVIRGMPTSVISSAYDPKIMATIHELFTSPSLRVYPNPDIHGAELGGALKNIIAIAAGASDGLGYGNSAKAALITRGLHEMKRLAPLKNAKAETFYGLSGMGDLCVTCFSPVSRNYRFGRLIAEGASAEEAKKSIGMVVEGMYTCLSALQLAKQGKVELPITELVYKVVYEKLSPHEAVKAILMRITKEEFA